MEYVMRELIKTSDVTLLSWLLPTLKACGLCVESSGVSTANINKGAFEGCHRIMVSNSDYWHARVLLAKGKGELTNDGFIGGKINLLQPKKGFRTSIDALLLAGATPVRSHQQVLELGSGGGIASLVLSTREKSIFVTGVEKDPFMVELAKYNACQNGLKNRVKFVLADVIKGPKDLKKDSFDHVMANPPYMQKGVGNTSPYPMKVMATVEGEATLEDWVKYAIQAVRPGGSLVFIHRPERISELIDFLAPEVSEFNVIEVFPRNDSQAPKRCLVRARKGKYVSTIKYCRLVLHHNDGSFRPEVKAILEKGKAIEFE